MPASATLNSRWRIASGRIATASSTSTSAASAQDTGSVEFAWAPGENYILAHHAIGIGDRVVSEGDRRIGWGAAVGDVRSWSFEADGGFGESVWKRQGDS